MTRHRSPLSDRELRERLIEDPEQGWRAFIDSFTPLLLGLIQSFGVAQRDDVMEVYVKVCEQLAADDCAKLRRHDPAKGALSAWLGTVVRNASVDWVRARAGRRRLFGSIEALEPFDRRVFELYYWERKTPSEMAESLRNDTGEPAGLAAVLDALERVEAALSARQRAELLALAARSQSPVSLDDPDRDEPVQAGLVVDTPETGALANETEAVFAAALAQLPREDALIVSLKYVDGLTPAQVGRALHIPAPSRERLRGILDRLRALLESRGLATGPDAGRLARGGTS